MKMVVFHVKMFVVTENAKTKLNNKMEQEKKIVYLLIIEYKESEELTYGMNRWIENSFQSCEYFNVQEFPGLKKIKIQNKLLSIVNPKPIEYIKKLNKKIIFKKAPGMVFDISKKTELIMKAKLTCKRLNPDKKRDLVCIEVFKNKPEQITILER